MFFVSEIGRSAVNVVNARLRLRKDGKVYPSCYIVRQWEYIVRRGKVPGDSQYKQGLEGDSKLSKAKSDRKSVV